MLRVFGAVCLSLVASFAVAAPSFKAHVVGVVDGDTLRIRDAYGEQQKVRLSGIDCPEMKQPWGKHAKQALSDYVFDKDVRIMSKGKDRYKRILATIYIGDKDINKALVLDGHCWVYKRYNGKEDYLDMEKMAKSSGRGLWSLPEAQKIPPWQWRRSER